MSYAESAEAARPLFMRNEDPSLPDVEVTPRRAGWTIVFIPKLLQVRKPHRFRVILH